MLIPIRLRRIVTSDFQSDQQIIYLQEEDGERIFPILIGPFEAGAIDRRVRGEIAQRPVTHDLLRSVIEHLGGEPQDVIINDLRDGTYYARIRIKKDGELIEVDSRPSDAIALSVHSDPVLPIYVEEEVLEQVI